MGKYLESAARLEELSRIVSSAKPNIRPKGTLPRSPSRVVTPRSATPIGVKVELAKKMEPLEECRTPLAKVVADCAKRWFQDTLKEAKAGDTGMQVLVGQMYNSGYGVPRDPQKVFSFFFYFYHSMSFPVQYINGGKLEIWYWLFYPKSLLLYCNFNQIVIYFKKNARIQLPVSECLFVMLFFLMIVWTSFVIRTHSYENCLRVGGTKLLVSIVNTGNL